MKIFMLLSAIPGSGKSTWAEQYKLTHENVYIVSSDGLRREIGGAIQNFDHEEEVWAKFKENILLLKDKYEDVTVIGDATNITNAHRKTYGELAKDFDKRILVVFKKKKEDILAQNAERGSDRIVPVSAIERMINNWEEPNDEVKALYDEIITIDKRFDAPDVKKEFHYN